MDTFKSGPELGQIIKNIRVQKGMSTRQLSRMIGSGIAETYISMLERGLLKKNINYDAVIKAFKILGLTHSEINKFIPLDIYETQKQVWLNKRVQHITDLVSHLPKEYKMQLVDSIKSILNDEVDNIHIRLK